MVATDFPLLDAAPLPPRTEMEKAYLHSDATYDGVFFLGVRTTGIFCRPSCSARKPKPENVEFFGTVKAAMFAGFRACLKCKPLDDERDHPAWVLKVMARVDADPDARIKDADVEKMGVEPSRLRRYFASKYGMTFQAYCRARRLAGALEAIKNGSDVDSAVFDAGYDSHSGFRDAFARVFGTTPGQAASADAMHLGWIDTPLGPMVAGATDAGLTLLEFTDRRMLETQFAALKKRFAQPLVPTPHRYLDQVRGELAEYFAGTRRAFDVPVVAPGTPFEEQVWQALLAIPYGETRSYEDIARALGNKAAVRAVGRANGMNRIAIVIPCHRVVNKSGALGGYGGGLWRKRRLLFIEQGGPTPS